MNILERAKKLVCDLNPTEAERLNMLDGRSVQTWPEWAQRDFKLACDAMVAMGRKETDDKNMNTIQPNTFEPSTLDQALAEIKRLNEILSGLAKTAQEQYEEKERILDAGRKMRGAIRERSSNTVNFTEAVHDWDFRIRSAQRPLVLRLSR